MQMKLENQKPKTTIMYFLKQRIIVVNLIVLSIAWLVWSFNYFLMNFQMKYLPGNINVNSMVADVAELLSYVVSGFFLNMFSIKNNLILFFIITLTGGCGALFYGLENPNWTFTIFIMLMKFGLCAASNICYIGTPKMFPTLFVVTAFGIVNLTSRICDLFAPMVNELNQPIPMIFFVSLSALALLASFFLLEPKKN